MATYNVHRWTGLNGRGAPDPARAGFVISELRADVIALQEVLRPLRGDDPLEAIADALGLHVAFAATRVHKRGELGNAILSRWPIAGVSVLDLSFSRMERRLAMAAQFRFEGGLLDVLATHLALGDRTRQRQVRSLLDHPQFHDGPTMLLGDMNAWRRCKATRTLDRELHHNLDWPPSFPSTRPVLALDRVYSRGVEDPGDRQPPEPRGADRLGPPPGRRPRRASGLGPRGGTALRSGCAARRRSGSGAPAPWPSARARRPRRSRRR